MRAIAHVLDKGGQCIVLVPEISLTAQVIDLFRSRFGDRVAILHSALSPGERFDETLFSVSACRSW
jgi:primosomal protein N' (replication factor Y)